MGTDSASLVSESASDGDVAAGSLTYTKARALLINKKPNYWQYKYNQVCYISSYSTVQGIYVIVCLVLRLLLSYNDKVSSYHSSSNYSNKNSNKMFISRIHDVLISIKLFI